MPVLLEVLLPVVVVVLEELVPVFPEVFVAEVVMVAVVWLTQPYDPVVSSLLCCCKSALDCLLIRLSLTFGLMDKVAGFWLLAELFVWLLLSLLPIDVPFSFVLLSTVTLQGNHHHTK